MIRLSGMSLTSSLSYSKPGALLRVTRVGVLRLEVLKPFVDSKRPVY